MMDFKTALEYWENRYNISKDYNDPHWEGQERREHKNYVDAMKCAVDALRQLVGHVEAYTPLCPVGKTDCVHDPAYEKHYHPDWFEKQYGDKTPEEVSKKYCFPSCHDGCCYYYDPEDK